MLQDNDTTSPNPQDPDHGNGNEETETEIIRTDADTVKALVEMKFLTKEKTDSESGIQHKDFAKESIIS